jgi:hypothetical protein
MKRDNIVLSFLKIDSIFTYNRWRENVRIYLYSIYMQVLLTVNKFSTNRRRLIVKQTTTTGEILHLQCAMFVTLFL